MARSDSIRRVSRQESRKYLVKAREFLASADSELRQDRWNSAGLNAVHAGISASDAAIVVSSGARSAANDHTAAVELLRTAVSESGATQLRQLTGLLGMKNTVEYEQRLLTQAEARSLVEQATRLVRWSERVVSIQLDGDA